MKKSGSRDKKGRKEATVGSGVKKDGGGDPLRGSEEVQQNNDEHIDQDFPGYPHAPSQPAEGRTIHNGSAGAFDGTEHSHDEEDDDQDSDDFAMDS